MLKIVDLKQSKCSKSADNPVARVLQFAQYRLQKQGEINPKSRRRKCDKIDIIKIYLLQLASSLNLISVIDLFGHNASNVVFRLSMIAMKLKAAENFFLNLLGLLMTCFDQYILQRG